MSLLLGLLPAAPPAADMKATRDAVEATGKAAIDFAELLGAEVYDAATFEPKMSSTEIIRLLARVRRDKPAEFEARLAAWAGSGSAPVVGAPPPVPAGPPPAAPPAPASE
jgi:hypothetical protein